MNEKLERALDEYGRLMRGYQSCMGASLGRAASATWEECLTARARVLSLAAPTPEGGLTEEERRIIAEWKGLGYESDDEYTVVHGAVERLLAIIDKFTARPV